MSDDPRFETETRDDFQVDFAHRLLFDRDTLEPSSPVLGRIFGSEAGGPRPGLVAVIDSNLAAARPELASTLAERFDDRTLPELRRILVVPGGETAKNDPAVVDEVLAAIEHHRIDRRSYVAVFGGGAVIDAAGFAASTAHRGVRVVRFASTVLAQLDAAIGVKNGVNRFGKKNFQGCFDVPVAVVCDERMLESLNDRDWRSFWTGMDAALIHLGKGGPSKVN